MTFTKFPDDLWGKFRNPAHGFVLLRIIRGCGFDGTGVCFESQESMANACGTTTRTISNIIKTLENEGFIEVDRRFKTINRITLRKTR